MRLRKNKANTLKVSNRGVIRADFHRNKWAYFMFIPVLVWYIVFCYAPMYGAIIAFKDYSPSLGILESKWVGLKWIKGICYRLLFPASAEKYFGYQRNFTCCKLSDTYHICTFGE